MRDPSVMESAGELIESGADRARDVLEAVAARAQEAVDAADIDPGALGAGAARAVVRATGSEVYCEPEVEAAADRLRLKTAVVTGVVAFILSALVFLAAREIARRSEQRNLKRRASERHAPLRSDGTSELSPEG